MIAIPQAVYNFLNECEICGAHKGAPHLDYCEERRFVYYDSLIAAWERECEKDSVPANVKSRLTKQIIARSSALRDQYNAEFRRSA